MVPGADQREAPRSPGCGGQRRRRHNHMPKNAMAAMMTKVMSMARSFGDPGEPPPAVTGKGPGFLLVSLRSKQ
jgi:hypothetical protein